MWDFQHRLGRRQTQGEELGDAPTVQHDVLGPEATTEGAARIEDGRSQPACQVHGLIGLETQRAISQATPRRLCDADRALIGGYEQA